MDVSLAIRWIADHHVSLLWIFSYSSCLSVLQCSPVFRDSLWLNVSSDYKHLTKANYCGSDLPFSSNSDPFGPSSCPPEAPQTCKSHFLLLEWWKVASLGLFSSYLSHLGRMWGLSSLTGRKQRAQLFWAAERCPPSSSCFSFPWERWAGREGAPSLLQWWRWAFLPRGEEKSSQVIRRKHNPDRTVNTCSSPLFKINVFVIYGYMWLNKFKCCFQTHF